MILKPVPSTPQFRWNSVAKRYIAPNGKFVSVGNVRDALDGFISVTTNTMKSISAELVEGHISLAAWQTEMMALSKEVNLAGAAIERGGWYNMTSADFGSVGHKIKGEYAYLRGFADDIASGAQRLDGTLASRSRLYGQQGRVTYHDFAARTADAQGMDEESSKTSPADHCESCLHEESRKWVPRGSLVPIGDRTCLSNCNCYMRYRSSITGLSRIV